MSAATTPQGRAVLCQDGQVTVGTVTYACTGSAHVSGMEIVCTSPAHKPPTAAVTLNGVPLVLTTAPQEDR